MTRTSASLARPPAESSPQAVEPRGAVPKPSATTDLRAARYRRRKARKFRTCTFSAGGVFTRLMRRCRKSLPRADLRASRYRGRKARKLRTCAFSAGGELLRGGSKARKFRTWTSARTPRFHARTAQPGASEGDGREARIPTWRPKEDRGWPNPRLWRLAISGCPRPGC